MESPEIWQFLVPPTPPMVFIARSYGDLSTCSWKPGLCGLAWGWDCLLPRYPFWFLSTKWECGTVHSTTATASPCHTTSLCFSAYLHNCAPPTHLDESGFFKSLVVGLPYCLIFQWLWVSFVLTSNCNSSCGCMRSVSTYASILIGASYSFFLPKMFLFSLHSSWRIVSIQNLFLTVLFFQHFKNVVSH